MGLSCNTRQKKSDPFIFYLINPFKCCHYIRAHWLKTYIYIYFTVLFCKLSYGRIHPWLLLYITCTVYTEYIYQICNIAIDKSSYDQCNEKWFGSLAAIWATITEQKSSLDLHPMPPFLENNWLSGALRKNLYQGLFIILVSSYVVACHWAPSATKPGEQMQSLHLL